MDSKRTVNKLLGSEPVEERNRGRQSLSWMDDVELDLRVNVKIENKSVGKKRMGICHDRKEG